MDGKGPAPPDGKSWKQANKEHFDACGDETFSVAWIRDTHRQITGFLLANLAWLGIPPAARAADGTGVRVLDYACGSGVLSVALAPFAAQLRGVDIAPAMVRRYNAAAAAAGLAPARMRAVEADLAAPEAADGNAAAAGAEWEGFDVALVSLALHHIEHPADVLRAMAARLAPGGKVVVVDWEAAGGHGPGHDHGHDHGHGHGHTHDRTHHDLVDRAMRTVVRHGFTEADMLDLFSAAGLVRGEFRRNPTRTPAPARFGGEAQLFFAVAEKPGR